MSSVLTSPSYLDVEETSVVDFGCTRTGVAQLRRRWRAPRPRATALLLHGLAEHSGRYEHVGAALAERRIETVAIDQRGHGRSGGQRAYIESFDDFLDDVEDQLAELRELGRPVVLIGHSMGGLVAAAYASSGRPPVDLLVMSAPALMTTVPGRMLQMVTRVIGGVLPRLPVPQRFEAELLSSDEGMAAELEGDQLRNVCITPRLGRELLRAGDEVRARLHRIESPTYVQHGGADRLIPPEASAGFAALPDATRVVYPGLAHEIYNEVGWAAVVGDALTWLNRNLASIEKRSDAETTTDRR